MIVIDASVGSKWLLTIDEAYRDKALKLLERHSNEDEIIIVPELFFYEISNAIATKTFISPNKTSVLLKKLFETNLSVYHPNQNDVIVATKLAKKHKTSVYDMLYAVIAQKEKAKLITADDKFIAKTKFKFVKHIKDL